LIFHINFKNSETLKIFILLNSFKGIMWRSSPEIRYLTFPSKAHSKILLSSFFSLMTEILTFGESTIAFLFIPHLSEYPGGSATGMNPPLKFSGG